MKKKNIHIIYGILLTLVLLLFIIQLKLGLINIGNNEESTNLNLYTETDCIKKNKDHFLYKCFYQKEGDDFIFDKIKITKQEIEDFFNIVFFETTEFFIKKKKILLYSRSPIKYNIRFYESLRKPEIDRFFVKQVNLMEQLLGLDFVRSYTNANLLTVLSFDPYYTAFQKRYLNALKPVFQSSSKRFQNYLVKTSYISNDKWYSQFHVSDINSNYTVLSAIGFASIFDESKLTYCSINTVLTEYFYTPILLTREIRDKVKKLKMKTVLKKEKDGCFLSLTNFDLFVLSYIYRKNFFTSISKDDFEKELQKL